MKKSRLCLALLVLGLSSSAQAQPLPPHVPGTICLTPAGWCWLPQQLPPNVPCYCPGPNNQPIFGRPV
jgi:hypothetical protein